jgi:hypothetical protein
VKFSYRVFLPDSHTIGVSDDNAGDRRFEEIYKEYGDCKVEVYDKNEVFGVGFDKVKPLVTSTINKLYKEV